MRTAHSKKFFSSPDPYIYISGSCQAHIISIPADNNGPCSDIQLYLSKRPPSGDENFYLQPNNTSWLETNIGTRQIM
ncbi:hypothetical protein RIR_jg33507.t1 [Rhizophagus irregularis DAOM 181602=DAOM 197198]|uniref:Uncharacterized protein n=1 Tax=Rhizophagus irregularis (strain DAOM 197198w) TaxID=1432141 RepID=A0A015I9E8_RHIIW|nr:hypothetical protein RirG_271070 [Rhizophagus irregularis DAOM 197198w]GBC32132.2 hypothetical protein RIR_jg33507.t1 [Rhizophagus irregularis DAOM 181602=DAOM 197198]